ncbi:MAG: endo-1,4-beta-xylanase [Candidatus Nanopelagicales bacterium]
MPRALFGTHLAGSAGKPLPPRAGAIRLWDAGVTWRELEPKRGRINWAPLDAAVAAAERTGAQDIMWVHGSTPKWAAKDPTAAGLYGPGTSSPPEAKAYLSFLRAIAQRYQGRITSYQVWNEANLNIFYRGSAESMAELTRRAKEVLRKADPDAELVGASTTIRRKGPVKAWYGEYADALAERDWPVDAMAIHLYPKADEGVGTRAAYARLMKDWLTERGWRGPIWDTEVNYGDRRDFAEVKVLVPQARAAAWVARTYLDSLALGIERVYWYSWSDHLLGVDQVDAETGEVLPAGRAFLTVQEWLDGAFWQGCHGELVNPTGRKAAVTRCDIALSDGTAGRILFSHGGTAAVKPPDGAKSVCGVDGSCRALPAGKLAVGASPVLVRS